MTPARTIGKYYARLVRQMFSVFGFELRRLEPPRSHMGRLFEMPIGHCLTGYGFAYKRNVGNPFVEFVFDDPRIELELTSFYRYARNYNPKNAAEAFYPNGTDHVRLTSVLIDPGFSKFRVPNLPLFWARSQQVTAYQRGQRDFNSQVSMDAIVSNTNKHLRRSLRILSNLKDQGFKLETCEKKITDAFVCGVLLKRGSELRFVVTSGQHRVGAMAALGYSKVPVLLTPEYPPIVDREFAEHWPIVSCGFYTREAALACFDRFFDDDGSTVAEAYGLITVNGARETPQFGKATTKD